MNIKEIIKKLLGWRLLTLIFAIPAVFLLSIKPGFTQLQTGFSLNNFLSMWANFDGLQYLNLAKYGYGVPQTASAYAYFPLYPWLISFFNLFGSYIWSGLFISHLSLILAIFYLYKLIKLDYSSKIANTTILLLMLFPTAFFFGSVYSESLFLLLIVLTFYSIRKKHFFLGCIFAALASITKVTGIFLWPAILYEFYLLNQQSIKKSIFNPEILWFVLPPLGLLSYMNFLLQKTGNALYFITNQPLYGANREIGSLVLIHQVLYRYLKMVIFVDHFDPLFFTVILELLMGLLFLALVIYGIKKLRLSYSIYILLTYVVSSLTGTFSGMPRHVLVLFPAFILMAEIYQKLPKKFQYIYLFINLLFTLLTITFFTRGYFIG